MKDFFIIFIFAIIILFFFLVFKVITWIIRSIKSMLRSLIKPHKKMHTSTNKAPLPTVYTIKQKDFERIVYKNAYRIHRIENVEITGEEVELSIVSQSSLSIYSASLYFCLSGNIDSVGKFRVISDHSNSKLPKSIAERIQADIRKEIGL